MCRPILSDLSLHCNGHINKSVRVLILRDLDVLGLVLLGVFGQLVDLLRGEGVPFPCAIILTVWDSSLILAPSRQHIHSLRACHVIVALLRYHVRFQVAVRCW